MYNIAKKFCKSRIGDEILFACYYTKLYVLSWWQNPAVMHWQAAGCMRLYKCMHLSINVHFASNNSTRSLSHVIMCTPPSCKWYPIHHYARTSELKLITSLIFKLWFWWLSCNIDSIHCSHELSFIFINFRYFKDFQFFRRQLQKLTRASSSDVGS